MAGFDGPSWRRDPNERFHEDLVELDPNDPEAQAFARHLDRMQRSEPGYTVESSIRKVAEFADSGNRASGSRWWAAVVVVSLMLFGVLFSVWSMLGQILN